MGVNQGGQKEEDLKGAMDVALQPGIHCGAQPREGKNQAVIGTPLREEEQRDLVQEWAI